MQLILLSGGSGKRLWPLSNNARSKQFLPLLSRKDGKRESMIQRVVRQIEDNHIQSDILIATTAQQRDSIINQLGEDARIVTEPSRRDTFPAIALSSMYLKMVAGCREDEVVVVMPCDPYADDSYFRIIANMEKAVKEGTSDLILMGIRPTYASPKYGYIVPKKGEKGDCLQVDRFVEKPTIEKAQGLLKEGAMWNSGVFAFKLGYLTDIVEKYISVHSYSELLGRYDELPKISFDYEVAEKAKSVAALPYDGAWKDLGTWNTLTEELPEQVVGNVVLGAKNENTHVLNELGLPIFCDGLKDVVVAASPDGILVCAKQVSETIKDYVDQLATRPMYEERRWGTYRVLGEASYDDGFRSLTKTITLEPGRNISYQIHHHRNEVWTFVDGEGLFVLDGEVRKVGRGDVVNIEREHLHAVRAISRLTFIEVQSGDNLVEEDIERFPYDWEEALTKNSNNE